MADRSPPAIKMTKHRKFMIGADGVHLMHDEFTLCGDAFDLRSTDFDLPMTDEEPRTLLLKPTNQRTVTCPRCIAVILLCRNVRIKQPAA